MTHVTGKIRFTNSLGRQLRLQLQARRPLALIHFVGVSIREGRAGSTGAAILPMHHRLDQPPDEALFQPTSSMMTISKWRTRRYGVGPGIR